MGTQLRVVAAGESREQTARAIESAFAEVRRLEDVLSSWRPDSDLSALNAAAPGFPQKPPAKLGELLQEVAPWVELTGGTFDPAVGALIDAWDLRGEGRVATAAELEKAMAATGSRGFAFGREQVTRLSEGAWLTAGAFGKGAALRSARRALAEAGVVSALLDFGGQLVALGDGPGEEGWNVEVAHPAVRDRPAARLRLKNASAATSGFSERFVEIDGVRYGHIVDPREGRPVPAWGSVTVVVEDPLLADLLSTALFVMGPQDGMSWLQEHSEVAALFLRLEEGEVFASWNQAMVAAGLRLLPEKTKEN